MLDTIVDALVQQGAKVAHIILDNLLATIRILQLRLQLLDLIPLVVYNILILGYMLLH